jgi:osmoprotectant transport system substrate-binding protein
VTRPNRLTALTAIAVLAASACGGDDTAAPSTEPDGGIRVASFDFAESVLLAEMYAQVIESTGAPVIRLGVVGPREIIAPALEQDRIDAVPEYLGSLRRHLGADDSEPDTATALADLDDRLAGRGLSVLDAAPAENKNEFAVTAEFADREDLSRISDLAPLAAGLRFGGTAECPDRALCLVGLEEVYGLRFAAVVAHQGSTFMAEALRREEIDVGQMFSTDAALVTFDLVVLDDDRSLQPAENIVPVVRSDAIEQWGPEVAEALNAMSRALTTRELRFLNVKVANDVPVETVARDWLATRGLVDPI